MILLDVKRERWRINGRSWYENFNEDMYAVIKLDKFVNGRITRRLRAMGIAGKMKID